MVHNGKAAATRDHSGWRGLLWPTLSMLVGLAVLLSLGTWQLQRKTWKEGLLADIAARTKATPIPLDEARRRQAAGEDVEYTRVVARGRFLHDKEAFVYASGAGGPGFHLYTPLEAASGAILFVNRGFVPEHLKDPGLRRDGLPAGEVEVVGLLRMPGQKGWFTPDQGSARDVWFWRDLAGMAASAFGNQHRDIVPFFVEAEASPGPGWPRGGVSRLELPNRHLEYALTWYGLAAALIGVYFAFVLARLRA